MGIRRVKRSRRDQLSVRTPIARFGVAKFFQTRDLGLKEARNPGDAQVNPCIAVFGSRRWECLRALSAPLPTPTHILRGCETCIDGLVMRRGQFRAKSTHIDLHRLFMYRADEDLPRVMKVTPSGRRAGIVFATAPGQPAMQINGIEIADDQISRTGLDWEWYLRSSAACGWGSMSLAPEDLAAASEAIIGRELVPPTFAYSLAPPTPFLLQLRKLHEAADHLANTAPDILANPEVARAMEQALVEAMVFCLAGSHSENARNVDSNRVRVMRRLEDALMANSGQPLYMAELSAQVGASYWTLRDCCLEYLGMSPKRYLWLRRMHLARRALRSADAERTTVTEIASNYGFWEFGRFSVAYRSLFGESPSATLRRSV
jgi:AraC-like DNA-binding protein